jgi:hypothetical protein
VIIADWEERDSGATIQKSEEKGGIILFIISPEF